MLFNSYEFIFLFVPLALAGYWLAARWWGSKAAIWWLVAASLFFYSWWNPVYLPLLLASVLINFRIGRRLARPGHAQRWILVVGVGLNIAALFYFKYTNFALDVVDDALGTDFNLPHIVLPLAISFFTFQQIAYLVDSYHGKTHEYSFARYTLFVTFFPQLIAGPIVHHAEVLPQFAQARRYRPRALNLLVGTTIFSVGLFKKIVLADGIAVYANQVFHDTATGHPPDFFMAWTGALCYTFQLYFDFSGYSDMAVGLARLFGVRLPVNFDSPLKSGSIAELWRRWHITLSRFMRDYVYIPLGGNRLGVGRTYLNVFITFFLCGLWHGAGWTYVVFGAAQGGAVVLNQWWARQRARLGWGGRHGWWDGALAPLLTLLTWAATMVLFRSPSLELAGSMLAGMTGLHGALLPEHWRGALAPLSSALEALGVHFGYAETMLSYPPVLWCAALCVLALGTPNLYQLMARYRPVLPENAPKGVRIVWRASWPWTLAAMVLALLALLNMSNISEFLYFQF